MKSFGPDFYNLTELLTEEEILKTLKDLRIVGSDIVELSPEIDRSGVSSIVAAKILRSLILSLENMQ